MHLCPTTVILSAFIVIVNSSQSTASTDETVREGLFRGLLTLQKPSNVTLRGEQYWQSEDGAARAFAYYGYKYGKAARFQESVSNSDFSYFNNADRPKLGHICPQLPLQIAGLNIFHRNLSMSEDCLYLDLYLPPLNRSQEKSWPILFWIHGGGFMMGDKDLYNGSVLAKATNAVVITVNHRLSLFGFLSTGDEAARGNYALGDLKLALNWTLLNAARFNGDPTRVTIFGESAGGALTSAMMLDDAVQENVFAAVSMSGNILHPWAIRKDSLSQVTSLASRLGCLGQSPASMVACLKEASWELILSRSAAINKTNPGRLPYAPVIDGKHIPKDPLEVLSAQFSGSQRNSTSHSSTYITGFTAEEFSFFSIGTPLYNATFTLPLVTDLTKKILSGLGDPCIENLPRKVQLIIDYYNVSLSSTPEELRKSYFKITTDVMFGLGSIEESVLYARAPASNNQLYVITYDPGYGNLGAFHFMDVLHLFRGPFDIFLKDKVSDSLTAALHEMFRQIAYDGRLNGPSFGREGNFLDLNQQAKWIAKKQDFKPLTNFWKMVNTLPCEA